MIQLEKVNNIMIAVVSLMILILSNHFKLSYSELIFTKDCKENLCQNK